ncbi:hypothetical protein CL673_07790 [Candidatus Bathyarchaeota archaeon]|nr:hypothetical protein [Nitrososphaerota archaeon]MBQ04585.1 hypothetical protein [Candidatus Bathyarchaeota archaeon]
MPIKSKKLTQRGPYSYILAAQPDRILYLAGLLAVDETGNIVGKGDMKAQIRQIVLNIEGLLKEAGATLEDVVRINIYTTNLEEFLRLGTWRSENFPQLWNYNQEAATSTAIGISALATPEYLLEIEATAAVNNTTG